MKPAAHLKVLSGATAISWRSGVFAGYSPASDESFAVWRGGAIQTATDYIGSVSWAQIENPARTLSSWAADPSLQLVLSVPMWPQSGGDLTLAAHGAYDSSFVKLGRAIVAAGRANTIVRLAWEFNTPYFRWGVSTPAQAAEYAGAWRHIVTAMRSVTGQQFTFVWNPDLSDHGVNPALAYPGNDYVDDIGLDVYDRDQVRGQSPQQRWNSLETARYGLRWQARFATAHRKPLAFPEWGLVNEPRRPGLAGGDDPAFISHMYDWFTNHDTAFEDYFDADPSTQHASFAISTQGAFPRAAAMYRRLFSGQSVAAAS